MIALLVSGILSIPARAASLTGILKSTGGVIVGTIYGAFFSGPVRGSTDLGIRAANGLSDSFGGGTTAKVFGYPIGAFAGGFAGAIVGIARGAVHGVYYGVKEPFSPDNLSVEGEFQDYDTLDFDL